MSKGKGAEKTNQLTKRVSFEKATDPIAKKISAGQLTELEKTQFAEAHYAEEQAKRTGFVLGGKIRSVK